MDVSTAPKCGNCGRDVYERRGRWWHRNAVVGCRGATAPLAPAPEANCIACGSLLHTTEMHTGGRRV